MKRKIRKELLNELLADYKGPLSPAVIPVT